jgi:hypothetical protein
MRYRILHYLDNLYYRKQRNREREQNGTEYHRLE